MSRDTAELNTLEYFVGEFEDAKKNNCEAAAEAVLDIMDSYGYHNEARTLAGKPTRPVSLEEQREEDYQTAIH